MASQICWRCLGNLPARSSTSQRIPSQRIPSQQKALITTSATLLANPNMKKQSLNQTQPNKVTIRKKGKKNDVADRSKKPAIGERKALRKRIVLSNNNALEIADLQDLNMSSVLSDQAEGQVIGIPNQIVDQLRAVEAFKVCQGWGLFRRPAMLVRSETKALAQTMEALGTNVQRLIIDGDRGSGKSVMILQAMAMAFAKGWTVINIPEAHELVIGHTEYEPVNASTLPTTYTQPVYTAKLLSNVLKANPHLANLQISEPRPVSTTMPEIKAGTSLASLAQLGISSSKSAAEVFTVLTQELAQPGRPPMVICLDGLEHIMRPSAYRDADFNIIHAHKFGLISWFVDQLTGKKPLPNGGLVLAATTTSNRPHAPTIKHLLDHLPTTTLSTDQSPSSKISTVPVPDSSTSSSPVSKVQSVLPYAKFDAAVLSAFSGPVSNLPQILRLSGISKPEARNIMEYWARSGVYRETIDSAKVAWEWTVSGGGLVGELERGCVRMAI